MSELKEKIIDIIREDYYAPYMAKDILSLVTTEVEKLKRRDKGQDVIDRLYDGIINKALDDVLALFKDEEAPDEVPGV